MAEDIKLSLEKDMYLSNLLIKKPIGASDKIAKLRA